MRPAVRHTARAVRPLARVGRVAQRGPRLTMLGWHRIDDSGSALSTPVDVFRRQLDVLEAHDIAVLPLDDALRRLAAGTLPPRAAVLTFDDGYASVLERAWPELRERGLPATLFVVSDYLSGAGCFPWDEAGSSGDHIRLAAADEIRVAAADGLDIGSHTVTHRWLPVLPATELAEEMTGSRTSLEALLGRPVRSMAYPMGGWNAEVRHAAAAAGYEVAITVDRGTNGAGHDRLALRRAFAPSTVVDFELLLAGAYTWLWPVDRWRTRGGVSW
jgi:peptidoglycan/xylan/chitin deacetylase (PgdA/CDA1 family)